MTIASLVEARAVTILNRVGIPVVASAVVGMSVSSGRIPVVAVIVAGCFWIIALGAFSDLTLAVTLVVALTVLPEVRGVSGLEVCAPLVALRLYSSRGSSRLPEDLRRPVRYVALFAALAAVSLCTAAVTTTSSLGGVTLRVVRLQEIAIAVAFLARIAHFRPRFFLRTVCLLVAGGAAVGIVLFALQVTMSAGQQVLILNGTRVVRAAGVQGDTGSFAMQLLVGVVALTAALAPIGARRIMRPMAAAVLLAVTIVALVLSFSRTGVFGAAILLGVLVAAYARRAPGRAVVIAAAAALSSVVLLTGALASGATTSQGWTNRLASTHARNDARLGNWARIRGEIGLLTFFTGDGYKTSVLARDTPPDNNYLSALSELGIGGLIVLLAFISALRRVPTPAVPGVGIALTAIVAFAMIFGDVLTYWRDVPLLVGVLVAVASLPAPHDRWTAGDRLQARTRE